MVAIPVFEARYVRPIQREITDLIEPARSQITHLQLSLALEGAALDDYLETRDPALLRRFEEIHGQEAAAYGGLQLLVNKLGPDVKRRFDELRALDTRRHARTQLLVRGTSIRPRGGDPIQKDLYEDVTVAAAQLDETVNDAGQARRTRIYDAERIGRRSTFALGLLGLVAISVVIWLARRLRLTAIEAEQRRQELAAAVESRSKLMRGVSHDLKNPLNAIAGHAQLIEDGVKGPVNDEQRESLRRIQRAVQAQLRLITDLLELSRAESGQLDIEKSNVDLNSVAAEAVYELSAAAQASGHALTLVPCESTSVVDTDPERVRQVLGNLLSNAIKYTPAGGTIRVNVDVRSGEGTLAGRQAAAVLVSDTGSGIPEEKLDSIFSEFTRLDPGAAEGSGLGLAIARRVARLLGGDITVKSATGAGSVFSLWLPLIDQGKEESRPTDRSDGTLVT